MVPGVRQNTQKIDELEQRFSTRLAYSDPNAVTPTLGVGSNAIHEKHRGSFRGSVHEGVSIELYSKMLRSSVSPPLSGQTCSDSLTFLSHDFTQ